MLALGWLASTSSKTRTAAPEPATTAPAADDATLPPPSLHPLRSPPSAVAELGILTERTESALSDVLARDAIARQVAADRLCGDEAACEATGRALRDAQTTHVQVAARSDWDLDRIDLDAATAGLSGVARKSLARRDRVVVVHVATATSTLAERGLAVRAAFAAAAAIAAKIDGLVYDPLLARIESATDFAKHVPAEPEGTSTFRRDRVELLYQPRGEGVVRILTAGLSRWGAPDVEAVAVPTAASPRVAEIVLAAAEAVANGLAAGPVTLTRAALERVRGAPYPGDAGLPADHEVRVDLAPVHPEAGDPNDFIARIVPADGEGPMGYLALAETFFGPTLAASPGEEVVRARATRAQRDLGAALGRWKAGRADGAKLLVLLPFPIPGDAGVESMWVDVTAASDRTVTGKLVDEPLGATDVARGDAVTRSRAEVEDLEERGAHD